MSLVLEHPKSKKSSRKESYRALSLFSGAGGMDIGVMNAGFTILASVEIDKHCCETLRTSYARKSPATKVIEADIRTINPVSLMADLNLSPGKLDLLFGGPPCQAFSLIGKRKSLNDERGMLLFEMIRFAEIFKPKAILLEQVKGFLSAPDRNGKTGGVFELFLEKLNALGYEPKWKVVNAAEYGVPQLRQRVFVVAAAKPNKFIFPPATHGMSRIDDSLFPLKPFVPSSEVLKGLPRPTNGKDHSGFSNHVDITPAGDIRRITGVPEGSHLAAQTHLPAEQRGGLTKKDTTKFRRLSRQQPSLTLRCGEIFFHPTEDRYLTPREYMRLHGYPDDHVLCGPIRGRSGSVRNLDQHRQVANSVPPPIAGILAQSILETLIAKNLRVIRLSANGHV